MCASVVRSLLIFAATLRRYGFFSTSIPHSLGWEHFERHKLALFSTQASAAYTNDKLITHERRLQAAHQHDFGDWRDRSDLANKIVSVLVVCRVTRAEYRCSGSDTKTCLLINVCGGWRTRCQRIQPHLTHWTAKIKWLWQPTDCLTKLAPLQNGTFFSVMLINTRSVQNKFELV